MIFMAELFKGVLFFEEMHVAHACHGPPENYTQHGRMRLKSASHRIFSVVRIPSLSRSTMLEVYADHREVGYYTLDPTVMV